MGKSARRRPSSSSSWRWLLVNGGGGGGLGGVGGVGGVGGGRASLKGSRKVSVNVAAKGNGAAGANDSSVATLSSTLSLEAVSCKRANYRTRHPSTTSFHACSMPELRSLLLPADGVLARPFSPGLVWPATDRWHCAGVPATSTAAPAALLNAKFVH